MDRSDMELEGKLSYIDNILSDRGLESLRWL